jgi:hypothetical protein
LTAHVINRTILNGMVGYMPECGECPHGAEGMNRLVTVQSDGSVPITTVLSEGSRTVINEIAGNAKRI